MWRQGEAWWAQYCDTGAVSVEMLCWFDFYWTILHHRIHTRKEGIGRARWRSKSSLESSSEVMFLSTSRVLCVFSGLAHANWRLDASISLSCNRWGMRLPLRMLLMGVMCAHLNLKFLHAGCLAKCIVMWKNVSKVPTPYVSLKWRLQNNSQQKYMEFTEQWKPT